MPWLIGIPDGPDRGPHPVEIVMKFRSVAIATLQVRKVSSWTQLARVFSALSENPERLGPSDPATHVAGSNRWILPEHADHEL